MDVREENTWWPHQTLGNRLDPTWDKMLPKKHKSSMSFSSQKGVGIQPRETSWSRDSEAGTEEGSRAEEVGERPTQMSGLRKELESAWACPEPTAGRTERPVRVPGFRGGRCQVSRRRPTWGEPWAGVGGESATSK